MTAAASGKSGIDKYGGAERYDCSTVKVLHRDPLLS
jgi:hypothetical protein